MIFVNLSNIAILNIKCSNYRYIINLISNNEAMNLMQNADLTEKSGALKNLFSYIKMGKQFLTFEDIEIEKRKFYYHKTPTFLEDVGIEKVLASNKISFGKKKTINVLLVTL